MNPRPSPCQGDALPLRHCPTCSHNDILPDRPERVKGNGRDEAVPAAVQRKGLCTLTARAVLHTIDSNEGSSEVMKYSVA